MIYYLRSINYFSIKSKNNLIYYLVTTWHDFDCGANAHPCFQIENVQSEAPTLICPCRAAQLPRMAKVKKKRLRQVVEIEAATSLSAFRILN